jgi:hypothetical protein
VYLLLFRYLLAETFPKREKGAQKYENQAGFSSICGNPTAL